MSLRIILPAYLPTYLLPARLSGRIEDIGNHVKGRRGGAVPTGSDWSF